MRERIFQMSDSRNSSKCLFEAVSFKMHTDLTILPHIQLLNHVGLARCDPSRGAW